MLTVDHGRRSKTSMSNQIYGFLSFLTLKIAYSVSFYPSWNEVAYKFRCLCLLLPMLKIEVVFELVVDLIFTIVG